MTSMLSTPSKIEALATAADLPQRLAAALANLGWHAQSSQRWAWNDGPSTSTPFDGGSGTCHSFAPELSYGRHFGPAPATARPAAVIALLFRRDGRWHLPMTLRPAALTKHGGQTSLPGGTVEPGELSSQAAIRELSEELGATVPVEIVGRLSDCYVYVSDFLVTPWLATTDLEPVWRPQTDEVEKVVELPLDALLGPNIVDTMTIDRGPLSFRAPCLRYGDAYIWGATSIILCELSGILRSILNQPS
jgi:8-oxo-dGTP pyrophosphatase MutT (NUDIX family)